MLKSLIEKYNAWRFDRMARKFALDRDYVIDTDHVEPDALPIRIITGDFAGTVYTYGQLRIEDDASKLMFDFTIIDPGPKNIQQVDIDNNTEFVRIVKHILTNLISEMITEEARGKHAARIFGGDDRTDYIEESDFQ